VILNKEAYRSLSHPFLDTHVQAKPIRGVVAVSCRQAHTNC